MQLSINLDGNEKHEYKIIKSLITAAKENKSKETAIKDLKTYKNRGWCDVKG